uniref:thymidylate kinase-like n=1 Tax=Styela clava TaxID=7725 RepID=UPI00193A6D1C|nr:thymidylate kinase-like [Styela clava]
MRPISRGALIVVEGIDRTGKSTQCDLLVKSLQKRGQSAKLMKFPDRSTTIGKMIDSYLKKGCDLDDHAIHLLFSANRWEANETMKKDLLNGTTLVIDRYAFSGVAYSSAKKGMDIEWCKKSDVGLPEPDVVMFLNLKAEEAQRRSGFGEERYEKKDFQKQVVDNFMALSNAGGRWVHVDAGGTIEDVSNTMTEIAQKTIDQAKNSEIKKLWV